MLSYTSSSGNSLRNLAKALSEAKRRGVNPFADPLDGFIDPDAASWIERHFYIPETNAPLHLEPYQRAALSEALSRDPDGLFKYSTIIWSDTKKSAKSTIAAAIALWRAFQVDWGQIVVIANDLKQADSRVGFYIRRAIELNPQIKAVAKQIQYKVSLPNHSFIESVPIDPSGEAGGNADAVFFCLDEQTEVLTKDGWKGWETLDEFDLVATRDKEGNFEWQIPKSVYRGHYNGAMYGIKHRSIDFLVTPNHRMFGKFIGNRGIAPGTSDCQSGIFIDNLDNKFLEAQDAANCTGYFPVVASNWNGGNDDEFIVRKTVNQPEITIKAKLFAEFMGWYLSEGCTLKKRGRYEGFAIGQSIKNHQKRERIINLLKEIGFKPRLWNGGMNIVVYHSEMGKYLSEFGLAGDKYIPDEIKNLNKECLTTFLKAYCDGDGTILWNGTFVISSKSKQMIDDLSEIGQKLGYWLTGYSQIDKRWKGNPAVHSLIFKKLSKVKRQKVEKRNWYKVDYDGIIFCPSTENGIIYIRRNNKYCWTGNSELWGAHEDAKDRMWTELTLPPAKFGRSFRWVETYAGYSGESILLERLYQQGVKLGRRLPDQPADVYVNDAARMFCMWNTTGRMPWHTREYYQQEESVLLPNEFRRVHKNEWVTSEDVFVNIEWWDACRAELPPSVRDEPWIIALDAAVSGDTFGMAAASRHPTDPTRSVKRYAKRWIPPKGGKIDYVGTPENPGPGEELRRLCREHNIVQVAYDPFQLEFFAKLFHDELMVWFRPFTQAKERLVADNLLRQMILDKRIQHDGDPILREHIQNANAEIDPEEHKIRIVKRSELLKIDLAVALSMANCEVMRLNL